MTGWTKIFLYGVRNPFRFSFDKNNPNKLYIGDVGQGSREEVDLTDVSTITSANNNFGWPFREGTLHNSNYSAQPYVGNNPIGEIPTATASPSPAGSFTAARSSLNWLENTFLAIWAGPAKHRQALLHGRDRRSHSLVADRSTGVAISGRLYSFGEDSSGELYTMWGNGNI